MNPQPPLGAALATLRARVADLIDPSTNAWHMPTILAYFNPITVSIIRKNPLSYSQHDDKLVWWEEPNGKFSVPSAYRLILRYQQLNLGESSSHYTSVPFWKALCKVRVPHKFKIFAWRAYLNGLPCFSDLIRRKVAIEGKCVHYEAHDEDLAHALFYYTNVRKWWSVFLLGVDNLPHPLKFLDLALEIFNRLKGENLLVLFLIASGI